MYSHGEDIGPTICNACQQPAASAVTGYDGEVYHPECVRELE